MKKMSYYISAAASMVLALAMTAPLQSCSNEDNAAAANEELHTPKLVIKEVNVGGGFTRNDNGRAYNFAKAITLYNNARSVGTLTNLAIGMLPPPNSNSTNDNLDEDGNLVYENTDWVPVLTAIWYIPSISVKPYQDIVIAVNGAIDHTQIASDAFSLADSKYYAMYDPESGFNMASYYPAPDASIPTANYWKAAVYGAGTAWLLSMNSPNLVLFQIPEGVDIDAYCADEANRYYEGGEADAWKSNYCVKVPKSWIIDAMETQRIGYEEKNVKRLPADIDAGFVPYVNLKGYSAYRNVDEAATKAIKGNADKLVYDYDQAVEGTEEPSGIDAAASIKNGATIIYQDTNNSSADFHLRKAWSLK